MTHSIQIGDYDTSYVVGGETGLHWFELMINDNVGSWRWQTDLTDSYFGDKKLFEHFFKWAEINASYSGIGLTSEDFEIASIVLRAANKDIYCDYDKCLGKEECSAYKGKIPDFTFTLSNRVNFTVAGD